MDDTTRQALQRAVAALEAARQANDPKAIRAALAALDQLLSAATPATYQPVNTAKRSDTSPMVPIGARGKASRAPTFDQVMDGVSDSLKRGKGNQL